MTDQVEKALAKYTYKDQPLFSKVDAPTLTTPPGRGLVWRLNGELKRNVTE